MLHNDTQGDHFELSRVPLEVWHAAATVAQGWQGADRALGQHAYGVSNMLVVAAGGFAIGMLVDGYTRNAGHRLCIGPNSLWSVCRPCLLAAAAGGFAACLLLAAHRTRDADYALGQHDNGAFVGHAYCCC